MSRLVKDLQLLMPPPLNPSETEGSWEKVEEEMNTPLPHDYKDFIGIYGSGYIGEMPLYINNALSADVGNNLILDAQRIAKAYQQLIAGGYRMRFKLFPAPGGLLPWGRTGNGDYLHWLTKG